MAGLLLPLTLLSFSLVSQATTVGGNQTCSLTSQKLQVGTYAFFSSCDPMFWCNSSSICDWKGCKRDDFPFGYGDITPPPKCPTGSFCPDEESACQPVLAVGSPCQLNRDDECEGPPNYKDLADTSGFGLNNNGSVCLNNICMWANVTLGQTCVVENTPYIIYTPNGGEYVDIVSRGNCHTGLYCDSTQLVCVQTKAIGTSCDADKECSSYNCLDTSVCGRAGDAPNHVGTWVYVVCAIGIFGGIIATLIGMFFLHGKQRDVEREKRLQYWREQNAFRQNIMQMQETARMSLMSLPLPGNASQRTSLYSRDGINSEDSQVPMLHAASKSSALRNYVSDADVGDDGYGNESQESIMVNRGDRRDMNRF